MLKNNKLTVALIFIISLLISLAGNWKQLFLFNNYIPIGNALFFSMTFVFTFGILLALFFNLKERSYLISILIILFAFVSYRIVSTFTGVNMTMITPNHFRTNIFTGKCNFGGFATVTETDPWYYKPDCELQEKIDIAKKKGFYKSRSEECNQLCSEEDADSYCGYKYIGGQAWGNGPEGLKCSEITKCTNLNCIKERENNKSNVIRVE